MMKTIPTTNYQIVKSFIDHPVLNKMIGCPDSNEVDLSYSYLLSFNDEKLIGCWSYRKITAITAEIHGFMFPEYQNKGDLALRTAKAAINYGFSIGLKNLIVNVPVSCKHIIKFLSKLNFKVVGCMSNSIIFNKKYEDQIIFQLSNVEGE